MKQSLLTLLIFASVLGANSQSFLYDFSVDNEPWQPLVNATELLPGEIWDDPELEIPIGFQFPYFGETYDTLFQIDLGSGFFLDRSHIDQPEGVPVPALFPYTSDIIDRGDFTGIPESPISYLVEGNAGNRIFKLEYLNAGFFDDEVGNDFVNFQMWLYEATGVIEVRFGPSQVFDFSLAHFDYGGPSCFLIEGFEIFPGGFSGVIENWASITGTAANPVVEVISGVDPTVINPEDISVMSEDPVDGTVFVFSPTVTSTSSPDFPGALSVYPSVAPSEVALELPEPGLLKIVTLNGTVVHEQQVGRGMLSLQVNHLPAGHYFVNLKADQLRYVGRFVKP
jgi:hypothetical protein